MLKLSCGTRCLSWQRDSNPNYRLCGPRCALGVPGRRQPQKTGRGHACRPPGKMELTLLAVSPISLVPQAVSCPGSTSNLQTLPRFSLQLFLRPPSWHSTRACSAARRCCLLAATWRKTGTQTLGPPAAMSPPRTRRQGSGFVVQLLNAKGVQCIQMLNVGISRTMRLFSTAG